MYTGMSIIKQYTLFKSNLFLLSTCHILISTDELKLFY